jgi:hypothetical protein
LPQLFAVLQLQRQEPGACAAEQCCEHGKQLRQWPVGGNILLVCSAIGTYFLLSLR